MKTRQEENKIVLRALEPDDLEILYKWENDRDIWKVSNTIVPFSRYILQQYIENAHLDIYQTKQLRLMIDLIDKENKCFTVGAIDLFDFDPFHLRAGIGILIGNKGYRNKGFAKQALSEIIKYAFKVLQLHQLYANITVDNEVSLYVFKNSGFILCGVKKDWVKIPDGYLDEATYQLLNNYK
jgi:diamine N-acetyltransferase